MNNNSNNLSINECESNKQGQIVFMSFEDALNLNEIDDNFDIKLHITRHKNKGLLKDFIHVPQLAPSNELFNKTMYKWKKLKFTNKEKEIIKSGETGTWLDLYIPEFNNEMENREDFIKCYNRLKEHLSNGKNIVAVCYCSDKDKCHRKLISNKLESEGYNSYCK